MSVLRIREFMSRTILLLVLISMLILTGCAQEKQNGLSVTPAEPVESEETIQEEVPEEVVEEEEEEELEPVDTRPILIDSMSLTKREYTLYENEKGKVIYFGDQNSYEHFTFALKYEGELKYGTKTPIAFRFIFEDGTSKIIEAANWGSYSVSQRVIDNATIKLFEFEHSFGNKELKRIDFTLGDEEDHTKVHEFDEDNIETIILESTSEFVEIEPLYGFETYQYYLDELHEDEEKTIVLDRLDFNDVTGSLTIDGTITFKEDPEYTYIQPKMYQPAYQTSYRGRLIQQGDFFGGIEVPISMVFETEKVLGNDEGRKLYFSIMDYMFSIDLSTGESIDEPLVIDPSITTDATCFQTAPLYGLETNDGEIMYNGLISYDSCFSDGLGTDEQGRQTVVLGGQYDTFTFTLVTGKETADTGGQYDFVIYEDNEKGRELLRHQINPTDTAKEFTVDVKGVDQIQIYFNTHIPSSSLEYTKLIHFMLVEPTLHPSATVGDKEEGNI